MSAQVSVSITRRSTQSRLLYSPYQQCSLLVKERPQRGSAMGGHLPINGHAHGSKRRETREPTFVPRRWVRCEDCDLNGRLDITGQPRALHKQPLRPVSGRLAYNPTKSMHCETCNGTGRVPARAARAGCKSNDPMEIPAKG